MKIQALMLLEKVQLKKTLSTPNTQDMLCICSCILITPLSTCAVRGGSDVTDGLHVVVKGQ